jgi:hypothetical protein
MPQISSRSSEVIASVPGYGGIARADAAIKSPVSYAKALSPMVRSKTKNGACPCTGLLEPLREQHSDDARTGAREIHSEVPCRYGLRGSMVRWALTVLRPTAGATRSLRRRPRGLLRPGVACAGHSGGRRSQQLRHHAAVHPRRQLGKTPRPISLMCSRASPIIRQNASASFFPGTGSQRLPI